MIIHVLPGDSLVDPFKETKIEGEVVVCRESLVDGDLSAKNLDEFWRVRESFLNSAYPKPTGFYQENVVGEFDKLLNLRGEFEVNLWFEYELFCQVNMWFCLDLLKDSKAAIYRVAPVINDPKEIWKGFGALDSEDLRKSFGDRKRFSEQDIAQGADLWKAFAGNDFETLDRLSHYRSECFPMLREVCLAAVEIATRPKETLQKIIAGGETEFDKVFNAFNETEGIYGFGDMQVKRIFDSL